MIDRSQRTGEEMARIAINEPTHQQICLQTSVNSSLNMGYRIAINLYRVTREAATFSDPIAERLRKKDILQEKVDGVATFWGSLSGDDIYLGLHGKSKIARLGMLGGL